MIRVRANPHRFAEAVIRTMVRAFAPEPTPEPDPEPDVILLPLPESDYETTLALYATWYTPSAYSGPDMRPELVSVAPCLPGPWKRRGLENELARRHEEIRG